MGLFGRFFGAKQTVSAERVPMQVATIYFSELRDDARVDVVGEVYHEKAIGAFARYSAGTPGKAVLLREPDNPHDRNAIMVCAYTDDNEVSLVGYIPREIAPDYIPVFTFLDPKVISCDAALGPGAGGQGTDGVALHLGTPGELIAELWADHHQLRTDHRWVGQIVAFTGEGMRLAGVRLDRGGQRLLARKAGCIAAERIAKRVQVCVSTDGQTQTENVSKAIDYGIPVVSETEFWTEVGVDPSALARGPGRWAVTPTRSR